MAVDPGRRKCGLALVEGGRMVWGEVAEPAEAVRKAARIWREARAAKVVVGDGTGSREVVAALLKEGVPEGAISLVPEGGSTLEGRRLYFKANRPKGLLGLIRRLLLLPPEPFDHYVAWAIALRRGLTKGSRKVSKI